MEWRRQSARSTSRKQCRIPQKTHPRDAPPPPPCNGYPVARRAAVAQVYILAYHARSSWRTTITTTIQSSLGVSRISRKTNAGAGAKRDFRPARQLENAARGAQLHASRIQSQHDAKMQADRPTPALSASSLGLPCFSAGHPCSHPIVSQLSLAMLVCDFEAVVHVCCGWPYQIGSDEFSACAGHHLVSMWYSRM
ncbi:hypothetical protein PspLS_07637 [Pyricularia sp. CBS 133598]|nr:hypothetical protein PspLS_07637 [Pyricularia sp. CBS 133598]